MQKVIGAATLLSLAAFLGSLEASAQAESGIVKVLSSPSGAVVSEAGKNHGRTPVLIELTAGRHKLVITREGYTRVTKSVTVKSDRLMRYKVNLRVMPLKKGIRVHRTTEGGADAGPATVTIATSPPGFTVFMNDLIVPQPTPVAFDIKAGTYRLAIGQKGEIVYEKTVFVRAGRTLELDLIIRKRRKIDDADPWK